MWTKLHGDVVKAFFYRLDEAGIKFFIIRNFEGLPYGNSSKDVDIILKHGTAFKAEQLLKKVLKDYGFAYYYQLRIDECLVCRGVTSNGEFSIHIDLMNGYINRGYELFSFEELYEQTEDYNGFKVLNAQYNGIMLFIYKQFGYKNPYLKQTYIDEIVTAYQKFPEFSDVLRKMLGTSLFGNIEGCIIERNSEKMLRLSGKVDKQLRAYADKKHYLKNKYRYFKFVLQKVNRIIFNYRKYEKSFSVMAPDGTGKTTFLEKLVEKLAFIYVNDKMDKRRYHVYHFRPSIFPNLGEVGEKAKIKKQDKDFTNPHRAKPAGFVSSIIRLTYYWLDYVIGWSMCTRKDVQYDFYTIYDRYSYDLLADPGRTRLNIPYVIRALFVRCMPHPKINFYLCASPETILSRKKELTKGDIVHMQSKYRKIVDNFNNIYTIDAEESVDKMADKALKVLIDKYWEKL